MDEDLAAFLKVTDPADNSTGGGTASAIAGAMGAALVAMVARLSIGRKGMKQDKFYQPIVAEAERLSKELLSGGSEDSLAFDAVMAGFKMPKETNEQKAARQETIASAMLNATQIPLKNAERCHRVLLLQKKLMECFNPNAGSDLECAGHLSKAGLLGCIANIKINLPSLKDKNKAEQIAKRAKELEDMVSGQAPL